MSGLPVMQRLVGAALRRYRVERGFSLADAALMIGCDPSKVSRIETGERGIREGDLAVLLAEYGVGEPGRAALGGLAGRRSGGGWWQEYAWALPETAADYIGLEAAASQMLVWAPSRVPALLAADAYARAMAGHDPAVPADAAGTVTEVTAHRQRTVLGPGLTQLTVVIGEAALRQQVGGADVMRAQLDKLARLAGEGAPAAIQVLPFSSGAHAGAGAGPLTVFRLAQAPGLGVVHVDGVTGGTFLDSPRDLDEHTTAHARLRASALSPEESAALLWRLAGQ